MHDSNKMSTRDSGGSGERRPDGAMVDREGRGAFTQKADMLPLYLGGACQRDVQGQI